MDFQTSNENKIPMGDLSALEKIKILSKQAHGYLAGAADSALLGAPSFIARKTGNEKAWNDFKAQNPYPESAEWSGNIASTLLPVGVPSKLAAGTMKATGKLIPRAAEKLGRLAEQTLQNSRYLQSLTGAKGMALRGATNAAWQSAPREAMKENPEWGSVPLEAAMGAVTGPVIGKVAERVPKMTNEIANYLYNKRIIPEGFYVHGRSGRSDLETGRVIQMSKSWDIADQYAGGNGSLWIMQPKKGSSIDLTDEITRKRIASKFLRDYKKGDLSPANEELAQFALESSNGDFNRAKDIISNDMNPNRIVESAGLWDMPEFPSWFSSATRKDVALVNDGAIAITPESLNRFMVSPSP